jgi:alkylhydroperoxidase/carboxymuconolactone decarboxylase family protein YurZ
MSNKKNSDQVPTEAELRRRSSELLSNWSEELATLLGTIPEYWAAYLRMVERPVKGGELSEKERELILVGVYAAPRCRHVPGIERHAKRAMAAGATQKEITQVLLLSAGIAHTALVGLPIAAKEFAAKPDALTPYQQEVKDKFVARRGAWGEPRDLWLRTDVYSFQSFDEMDGPARDGLDDRLKELVLIGIGASITVLNELGIKNHIALALQQGISEAAILDVFRLLYAASIESTFDCLGGVVANWAMETKERK